MEGIVFEGMSVVNIRDMSNSYHFLYFYEAPCRTARAVPPSAY